MKKVPPADGEGIAATSQSPALAEEAVQPSKGTRPSGWEHQGEAFQIDEAFLKNRRPRATAAYVGMILQRGGAYSQT